MLKNKDLHQTIVHSKVSHFYDIFFLPHDLAELWQMFSQEVFTCSQQWWCQSRFSFSNLGKMWPFFQIFTLAKFSSTLSWFSIFVQKICFLFFVFELLKTKGQRTTSLLTFLNLLQSKGQFQKFTVFSPPELYWIPFFDEMTCAHSNLDAKRS